MLYVFTKSFVNLFVDIALTFSDSLFSSFSIRACFALFEVILLSNFFSLSSKSVFFTKLAILLLLAKFGCANLAAQFSAKNLLNSGVVIYLLLLRILFSTAVRAVGIAMLIILGILFLTSFVLALRAAVVAKISFFLTHLF